ncbi:hypothetical protein HMPREF0889_1271 [Megasphaera lornae]|uniref:Uncharacterized protein n=1 Tax=Megasphaera lornae TaxID=1000568 RepID=D3LWC7_9FIRM|nr:hypothetical protein [Megasphaera genomosp. type_1]EFD93594.1 hypothetical protein HMPREF0889_1271 [Megasphaera genomosp. type_1 str. 28L]
MAKTIKFNLILDNYPVRNIEGLQEHFSIEDMLKYFENGLLLRWLNVRGYDEQYAAVEAIDKSFDRKEIVTSLVKIFEVGEMDIADIEKAIGILTYLDEEKELNAIYKENAYAKKQIVDDYHSGYTALIMHMEENKDNIALLKADAIQMEREYFGLFELNYYELYFRLVESAPKAIFAILTRNAFRKYWIGEKANEEIYESIKTSLLVSASAKKILGADLKVVKRNTQAMWDPIERAEVKVMVISIVRGTFIKNAGNFSEKLGAEDVNEKLLKFRGLEYQCNNEKHELLYMEV